MKINTKIRYGIRTVLEIGLHGIDNGILQKDIAENQNLSYKYLDQILNSLKVAGLVIKAQGTRSGYILSRDPSEITLYDIHNAFERGICVVSCMSDGFECELEEICACKGFWSSLNNKIIEHFKSTSIQDLIDKQKQLVDSPVKLD